MRVVILLIVAMTISYLSDIKKSYAESEADCAIWICLPGGFPSGCEAAYEAFRKRIKRGRAPLPALSSCMTTPGNQNISGNYELGRETFMTCRENYSLREGSRNGYPVGRCYMTQCAPIRLVDVNETSCPSYEAERRVKQNYVKMWVNEDYLGQFWY